MSNFDETKTDTKMYAILFDLDTNVLNNLYPNNSRQNAYKGIEEVLKSFGFTRKQGSVYFPKNPSDVNAVTCVLAAQAISKKYDWFKSSVKDIRLLRIDTLNDLKPAL